MCVQLRKMSLASTLAYYQSRLLPPGAHLTFMELPLVPIVKNRYMSTILCVSNCCKSSSACPLAYYHGIACPFWAHLSFIELPLVLVVQT